MMSPSTNRGRLTVVGIVALFALLGGLFAKVIFRNATPLAKVSAAPHAVRLGSFSTAIDYSPYLVAKAKGWFEEALKPLNAVPEYTTFQTLPSINESFASGRTDAVFEAEPPAIIGRASGIQIKMVGISCSLKQEIIVPVNSTVSKIADLKGKRVAVLAGTSSHYALLKLANQAGLAEDAMQVLDMAPPDAKAAFETGQVDAWAVWPPWVEQELVAKKARVLKGGDAGINSILAARAELIGKDKPIAEAIAGVLDRAKKWVAGNPAEAQALVAKELGLDPQVVQLAWPKHDWRERFTPAVVADIQAKADFLWKRGLIKNHVDVASDLLEPLGDSK